MTPGFHDDVPEQEYHADKGSLSVSGAKVLLQSPAKFRWQQDHPVYKDVFDFGTAAHRLVLGVGPKLIAFEYDAEKVKSPKSTNAWKERQAEVRKTGDVLLLPDEMATVQAMADKLAEHETAMALMAEGKPEVSAYAIDDATGVMRRGRFDWLTPDLLIDYKTALSCNPREFGTAAARYGYDQQDAWYSDLARDLGMSPRGFVFIVQEKEAPYEVACIQLDQDSTDTGRVLNRAALERYRDCMAAGVWPTANPAGVVAAQVPPWRHRQANELIYEEDVA